MGASFKETQAAAILDLISAEIYADPWSILNNSGFLYMFGTILILGSARFRSNTAYEGEQPQINYLPRQWGI